MVESNVHHDGQAVHRNVALFVPEKLVIELFRGLMYFRHAGGEFRFAHFGGQLHDLALPLRPGPI